MTSDRSRAHVMGLGAIAARRALKNPQRFCCPPAPKQKTLLIPPDSAPVGGGRNSAARSRLRSPVKKIALITAIFLAALPVVLKVEEGLC
jgi:hypothetical protein